MNESHAWQVLRAKRILEMLENMDNNDAMQSINEQPDEMLGTLDELTAGFPPENPIRKAIVSRNYDNWLRSKHI